MIWARPIRRARARWPIRRWPTRRGPGGRGPAGRRPGWRSAGLALIAVALLPPAETLARRYLFVGSIQFCLLSMAGPALIVLGAPWRVLRLSRGQATEPAGRPDRAGASWPGGPAGGRKATQAVVRQGRGLRCLVGRYLPLLAAAAGSRCPGPLPRAVPGRTGDAGTRGGRPLARAGEFTAAGPAAHPPAARRHRGAGDVVHLGDRVRSRVRQRLRGARLRRPGQFAGDGHRPGDNGVRAVAGGCVQLRSRHLRLAAHLAEGRRRSR